MIQFRTTDKCLKSHFHATAVFAKENPERQASFRYHIHYLDHFGGSRDASRCVLYKDFAPHSFTFDLYKKLPSGEEVHLFYGGFIYSAATDTWSIHT